MVGNFIKIDCYIQARSTSTRLPGKIFKKLGNKSILQHVYERCCDAEGLRNVVVLIPSCDAATARHCIASKIPYYVGSKYDLVQRYADACKKYKPTHFVRITSDCPFINAAEITHLCAKVRTKGSGIYDMFTNQPTVDGLEIDIVKTSEFLHANEILTKGHPDREHVTRFMHWGGYNIYRNSSTVTCSGKMSVDTIEDYNKAKSYYNSNKVGKK